MVAVKNRLPEVPVSHYFGDPLAIHEMDYRLGPIGVMVRARACIGPAIYSK